MIKRLFILCVLIYVTTNVVAQQYGNEWINYSQKHYRINIPKTGLYRIDYNTLINSGIPLSSLNPKNFQLFIKGQEQHIYINGETDNVFDTNDYIEFFARKNDAISDSSVYYNITRLPNPYIALYNDTNTAFLTWNALTTNKRVSLETDINFTSYTPTNYFYSEKIDAGNGEYSLGTVFLDAVSDPRYIKAEGYGTNLTLGNFLQTNFLNVYSSPTLPVYIKASYSGSSEYGASTSNDHEIKIEYLNNTSSFTPLHDTLFFGVNQFLIEKQITSDNLSTNSIIKITSVNNPSLSTPNNSTNVHYTYIKYPQNPDFLNASEQLFFIDDNISGSGIKTFIDFQNVNVGTSQVVLYDLTNHKCIATVVSGSNVKALIPNSFSQKECFLTTTANINNVVSLNPVNQTGLFNDYTTSNMDSAYIIVTHKSLMSSATNYAQYRQSIAGGSHHTIIADVDDLYDQFAYGNIKNPIAIRNFCNYLGNTLPTTPKYLLLLGKSIKNSLTRTSNFNWESNLVPTMGTPSSDNLITTTIHGYNSSTPFIPTGRVSAKNNADIDVYLNKLKAHEDSLKQNPMSDWHKHVLHFAGGANAPQQASFVSYLQSFGNIIKDTLYGAEIFHFEKTSTAPIQITVSDSITQLINYGASLITFFGHGSVSGFDISIDDPTLYNNQGKYPVFLANSCYSGDIHLPSSLSTSENFTFINDKGSIGFIASSSAGVVNTLYYFTQAFYQALTYETYYKGIGDAIKSSSLKNSILNNQLQEITSLEMTLEGDPAVKLNAFTKPDYKIDNTSVSFNTSAYIDSIGINVYIKNNGKAIRDTFVVKTERLFPNGTSQVFYKRLKAPMYDTTLRFFVFKDYDNGIGINHFNVMIDAYSEISELSENNNSTIGSVDLFIPGGDVIPVYPYKYAIIPNTPQITLKATTADPFAPAANYIIQLDTNDTFSSPINSTVVNSVGGVINWTVNLPLPDSTVYFWRITKDSTLITDRINWRESSFQVITNKTGWEQAHFHQFKNDRYQFVNYVKPLRKFKLFNNVVDLKCRNGRANAIDYADLQYSLNGSVESNYHFATNGWSFAVLDSISLKPWTSSVSIASTYATPYSNCLAFAYENRASFDFGPTSYCGPVPNWQSDMVNFINAVPENDYILAYSSEVHGSSTFSNTTYNAFETFGSANIRSVSDSLPMIIFGKKRSIPVIGSAHEVIGVNPNVSVILEDSVTTRWKSGFIESEIIGPSSKWNSLHWRYINQSTTVNDSITLKVIGLHINGNIDTLATFKIDSSDVYDLSSYINAANYPKIKLIALLNDNPFHLAPQLKKWQVMYDPVPECAINPQHGFTSSASVQAIQQGDALIVRLPIENIGTVPFTDSLVVTYWIEDANRVIHPMPQKLKANPFVPSQIIMDTIRIDSLYIPGMNYLWVDVNPEANPKHQLEQYHFNNIARIGFTINKDNINPLLDVTFDGNHILNGDIISSKPYVLVTLKDENRFLALDDTLNFKVFIRYPNQSIEKRLFFSKDLQFTKAQLPNNSCRIEWKPEFASDGKYKLIVQATDRSRNASGSVDYNIQFEIINKQTVTEVLNYPNPFSTSTHFVFTLTGSEVPDIFIIQIMTITGKVVKEITKNELGNLHIGRNITSYAWDGKDEFGDKLANGVYLYRVITRHNGQAIEKTQTEADAFFKKGIGKLVIIR